MSEVALDNIFRRERGAMKEMDFVTALVLRGHEFEETLHRMFVVETQRGKYGYIASMGALAVSIFWGCDVEHC